MRGLGKKAQDNNARITSEIISAIERYEKEHNKSPTAKEIGSIVTMPMSSLRRYLQYLTLGNVIKKQSKLYRGSRINAYSIPDLPHY